MPGTVAGPALVVLADQLDRPAEQPASALVFLFHRSSSRAAPTRRRMQSRRSAHPKPILIGSAAPAAPGRQTRRMPPRRARPRHETESAIRPPRVLPDS